MLSRLSRADRTAIRDATRPLRDRERYTDMTPDTVRIGEHEFDYIDWDDESDVLYLAKGGPRRVPGLHASPEGHHLRIDEDGDLQGVTLVGPRDILRHDGRVPVSMPDGTPIGDAEVAQLVLSAA